MTRFGQWSIGQTLKEPIDRDAERIGDTLEPRRADPNNARHIFLQRLPRYSEGSGDIFLRATQRQSANPDLLPDAKIDGKSSTRIESVR